MESHSQEIQIDETAKQVSMDVAASTEKITREKSREKQKNWYRRG